MCFGHEQLGVTSKLQIILFTRTCQLYDLIGIAQLYITVGDLVVV